MYNTQLNQCVFEHRMHEYYARHTEHWIIWHCQMGKRCGVEWGRFDGVYNLTQCILYTTTMCTCVKGSIYISKRNHSSLFAPNGPPPAPSITFVHSSHIKWTCFLQACWRHVRSFACEYYCVWGCLLFFFSVFLFLAWVKLMWTGVSCTIHSWCMLYIE